MTIKDWPDDERPREKLLQRGPEALTDAELVAILLRVGVKGKSAVDLARDLLAEHGSLRGLLGANLGRFSASKGMGEAKFVQFQAALEIGRRYLRETLDRTNVVESPESAHHYIKMRLVGYPHEVFACLFLDNRHRVIEYEELFRGTIDGASVHPREVVRRALAHNAAAVILAHNHPSGVAEPSDADRRITLRLKDALALVDVRVLDHIIVGDGAAVTSLANRGWV